MLERHPAEQADDMTHMDGSAPTPSSTFGQNFRQLGALRRARDHRALGGVAEGLSRHFDIDPIIVRVTFAALTLFGGAGIILYIALWLTVPTEGSPHSFVSGRLHRDPHAWVTIGLGVGGVLAIAALLGSISWAVPHPFPLFLIVLVLAFGYIALNRRSDSRYVAPPPPPSGSFPASSAYPATPSSEAATTAVAMSAAGVTGVTGSTDVTEATDVTARIPVGASSALPPTTATAAWWQRGDQPPTRPYAPLTPPPPPPPQRPKSHLFALTMATIAFALAGLWIVDGTTSYDVSPAVYPGTAVGIIAAALLIGTWWGRSRGLIAVGLFAAVLTTAAAIAGPGPYGYAVERPRLAADLASSYDLGVGRLDVHLEQIADREDLEGHTVHIEARFGRVTLLIPSTVAVTLDATVDHGSIDGPLGVSDIDDGGQTVVMAPPADGRPTVSISVHLRFGQLLVQRVACPGAEVSASGESTIYWKGNSNAATACN